MPAWRLYETRFRRTQFWPVASLLVETRLCEPDLRHSSQCGNALQLPFHFQASAHWRSTSATSGIESEHSYLLRSRAQNTGNQQRHAVPLFGLRIELAPACRGQAIELCFAVVLRFPPLTVDP